MTESTDLQSSADLRVQLSDLSEVITRSQNRVALLREENRLLRVRLGALEDRVARLEDQDREAHLRLQRRFQPSDCAIGCLTTRVIHLGSCFQYLGFGSPFPKIEPKSREMATERSSTGLRPSSRALQQGGLPLASQAGVGFGCFSAGFGNAAAARFVLLDASAVCSETSGRHRVQSTTTSIVSI